MALYCDPDDLSDAIGAHSFDAGELVAFCTRASNRLQAALRMYWPFPDYNATVSTPEPIREAALEYAKHLAKQKQGEDNLLDDQGATEFPRARFDEIVKDIRDTESTRLIARVTGETLDFGAHNSEFVTGYDDAHVLAWQDIEIEENTAAIDGFHRAPDNFRMTNPGGHFGIRYDDASGLWLLWRFTSNVVDDMTVSYTINFKKWVKGMEDEAGPVQTAVSTGRRVEG